MKILEFHAKNFRSLRDVHLNNLGNLNVFIGKNSSGKSNMLEGLAFLFDNFSMTGGVTPGVNEYLWYNKRIQEPIEFSATVFLEDAELRDILPKEFLEHIPAESGDLHTLSLSRRLVGIEGQWRTNYVKLGNIPLVLDDGQLSGGENVSPDKPSAGSVLGPQQMELVCATLAGKVRSGFKLIPAVRDARNPPVPERMLLVDPQQQNQLWNWDQSTGDLEQDKWNNIETAFADVTDLRLDMSAGQVYVKKPKKIPIASEGGGVQASLSIIFSLSLDQEKNRVFAIEEPESHSHFEYQKQFFQIIHKFAESNQIFLSTHSPVFVDRADPQNTWLVKLTENGTAVKHVAQLKEILDEIGARPSDVFFFANRIVFVQSESDEIIVRSLAKIMGKDVSNVMILPLKNNGWLHSWLDITQGTIPIYLMLGTEGEAEAEKLIKEGQIDKSMYHVWKLGAIEEYYPTDVLRSALESLNARYKTDIDPNKIMKQIKEGKFKASTINLGEKEKVLGKPWKVLLAEQVAELLPKGREDLRDEVSIVMNEAIPN